MNVLLYAGSKKLVSKSGVGMARSHQEEALKQNGVVFTENPNEDYDVVHINTVFPTSYLMAKRAKREGKKVICHGHSTMEDFRNSFVGSNAMAPLFKKWIIKCYDTADLVLTPTEYSRRILKSYGLKAPILPISNGIDTDAFRKQPGQRERFRRRYGLKEGEKAVVSVGLPIERKGILDFIQMALRFPEYRFFWFGAANPLLIPKEIKRAIREAPKNVSFPGYVGQEELLDVYGGADLFLFLSKEETEGIVVLEALAMEIPVLLRDIPVYDGWIHDGKEAYRRKGFDKLAQAAEEILDGKLPDLSANGRKLAESRNLKITGQRLASIYRGLYNEEVSTTKRQFAVYR